VKQPVIPSVIPTAKHVGELSINIDLNRFFPTAAAADLGGQSVSLNDLCVFDYLARRKYKFIRRTGRVTGCIATFRVAICRISIYQSGITALFEFTIKRLAIQAEHLRGA
jgi:hypothetical protein